MTTENKLKYGEWLKTNKILLDLPPKDLLRFTEDVQKEIWPPHTCSTTHNYTRDRFHFIVSGKLKVFKIDPTTGREFILFLLTKNDAFDLLCLLDNCDHEVHYEALKRTTILSKSTQIMRQWVKENKYINRNVLPYLSQRMRLIEDYAANITLIDISTRLARLILNNINKDSKELELINDLSNEELAQLIGSTRAVVNRHLQIFKQEGILDLGRQSVQVKNLQLLLEKAKSTEKNIK